MKTKLLVGITGSFCNHEKVFHELCKICNDYEIDFVFTKNVVNLDTRFYKASEFYQLCSLISKNIIIDLVEAEKIGPSNPYDLMVIVPCTANTLSRIVHGGYDCPVALCAKAMIRNQKNVLIGVSSNDILGISGVNLMQCLNMKYFYFIPFYQDDCHMKPRSCTCDISLLKDSIDQALNNEQIQPILREKK